MSYFFVQTERTRYLHPCAKRIKIRGPAGLLRIASGDSWDAGSESSLVARSKKERHPHGCLSFLEQHFCYAKVVACGRVIEREWGNPSKVPPSHSPFLAVGGSADNKTCGQSQKETPSVRMVFSFLEQHFCYAKVVACGRVIERERGIAPAFSAVVRWRWLFQR